MRPDSLALRYPRPLVPGDRIGVTAPSSGVPDGLLPRMELSIGMLRERGYEVELGECLDGSTHVSAPVQQRADELMRMLLDPGIAAVLPPWGGETAIDLLPLLDFDALAAADPCWLIGYSDLTTLMVPLTLLAGIPTLHGTNLMDQLYGVPDSLLAPLEAAALPPGSAFRQSAPGVYRAGGWDDWAADPAINEYDWDGAGGWRRLDEGGGDVDVRGRLIGGCIEVVAPLAGTGYADTSRLRADGGDLIVYVEAAEDAAFSVCRALHGMRLAGFFDGAAAIMVGRTSAPDSSPTMTQDEAVLDALGGLGVPIIADVECGHVPPRAAFVNGARCRFVMSDREAWLEQTLA